MKNIQKISCTGKRILCALTGVSTVFGMGCGSDETGNNIPGAPAEVEYLLSPLDGASVKLEETENVTFIWAAASWRGTGNVTYEIVFDGPTGDFSDPFYSSDSGNGGKSTIAVIPKDKLNSGGMTTGGSTKIKWAVRAYSGDDVVLSTVASSLILLPTASVTTLLTPADGTGVDLSDVESMNFTWAAAQWDGEGNVTYELVLDTEDGNFSNPLLSVPSSGEGAGTGVGISKETLVDAISRYIEAISPTPKSLNLKWAVRTTSEGGKAVSAVSNRIVFTKFANTGPFTVGMSMFMAGPGSEEGQKFAFFSNKDPNEATITVPYYEIYTKLTAGQVYYFRAASGGGEWFFTSDTSGGIEETDEPATTVPTTAVYRIRLDFAANKVTFETIDKITIRLAWDTSRDKDLTYAGTGTWEIRNHNVFLVKNGSNIEERYKFLFTIDGTAGKEHWGYVTGDYSNSKPAISVDRKTKKVGTAQWDGTYKYPAELCDVNNLTRYYTDIVLHMNTRTEGLYTHYFENWYDTAN